MKPRFELFPEPLSKSCLGQLARYDIHQKTICGGLNRSIFHLTQDCGGAIIQACMLSSVSKLPILTDKSLKITLLPRKSEKRSERETS